MEKSELTLRGNSVSGNVEVLETAEGWSVNRGTPEDVAASRRVSEWLETKEGQESLHETAEILQDLFDGRFDHMRDKK